MVVQFLAPNKIKHNNTIINSEKCVKRDFEQGGAGKVSRAKTGNIHQ